ncbi:MAG: bifunctional (p)ppGpp synthetase/guanosine-3',5'-bis(diphosphate) 3'-pyrophosphohydrolase [Firmicutes bacterium]|nr:bifunctional (p)ppGpp synthetase/guanosine-3',5'-bis(diphosphate) 3'-pyrophosphohydrolase [Clostridia bacterium]MBS6463827.1 bifunctional (p)ppGpp synthetase/guanosine-3',5'-bis(diphosphate) 3'-pyrophosphohydrolase [Bacillota bacterium]
MDVLERIRQVYTGDDLSLCERAYDYAKKAHANQKRASGEEYFTHPCAVASILIDLGLDAPTIAAAFLHDVIEDTPVSEGDVRQEFGDEVLELVLGVTKLEKIEFTSQEEEQAENFRKIFVAMAKDIRVIIIKLADRLHNMRSLNFLSKERQQRLARETLDIFAPLAGRLGISQIKCELEDLSLKYLEPEFFEFLVVNINQKVKERREFVDFVVKEINGILVESGIEGKVFGRPKHFYSIYKKMKNQHKTLDQIYDLTAVRVIVADVNECYEIFGKIHHKWKPIPGRIKDYIATPKPNMYQSLHTTVVTDFGQIFEIQIRTFEMDRAAEYGIAAHWKYKENKTEADDFDTRLTWIREVMEWQGGLKDSKEFLDSLKGDIYSSEVLVFTPKGDVISLPKDATPIDFAYAIHSAVGNRCVGAKVNGKMVPLNTPLQVGDVVEVITSQNSKGPSWDWLKIVKGSSTKVKIKQFFKREMKEENIKTGKSMLEAEAKRKGFTLSELLTDEAFLKLSSRMSFSGQDEMFASVGYGAVTTNQILLKLIDHYRKKMPKEVVKAEISRREPTGGVVVKGMSGLLVRYAGCCTPVPGDEIVGFISRGRGVTIHRADCPNMKTVDRDRLIEVSWANQADIPYKASIRAVASDQGAILAAVSTQCALMNLTITSINGRLDAKTKEAVVDFNIRLNSRQDLDTLISKLKQDKKLADVYRTSN